MNTTAMSLQAVKKHLLAGLKILLIIIIFGGSLSAQVSTQWIARYNRLGNSGDYATALKVDGLGNIYAAGYSQDINGFLDCSVIKYNPAGILQWAQHYSGQVSGMDYLFDIALDNTNNVYVTGSTWVDTVAKYDCLTLKYNSNGVQQWSAIYNGSNLNDEGKSIAVDNSGNVYITGKSDTLALNAGSFITIKYNPSGIQQWVAKYSGVAGSNNSAVSIAIDNTANLYITGFNAINPNNLDYVTIKYNTNGSQQWTSRYNGTGNSFDIPRCLILDSLGNIYVTGESSSANSSDCLTLKYNSGGALLWTARYNGSASGNDAGNRIALDNSGNVFIAGRSTVSGAEDMLTLKYSPGGTLQWANTYNGTGNGFDDASSIALDNSGNAYITGYTTTDTLNSTDYTTIRYNSNGSQQWIIQYDGGSNSQDVAVAVQLDPLNNVIVTGRSIGSGTGYDLTTIKYSQIVGVTQISNEIPKTFSLSQNYPNPFNPSTKINFSIPVKGIVRLNVYDVLGNEISVLVNEVLSAGIYTAYFDASSLASSIYFCVLKSGNYKEVRKMILTK